MANRTYLVEVLPEFNRDGRGVAFLVSNDDRHVDAVDAFDGLSEKRGFAVRTRFEAWLDHKTNNRWFHGWPNHPKYKDCFVFKWKTNRQGFRLYGFVCKPDPVDGSYQLCVLVLYATKNEHETETSELDRVVERSNDEAVRQAVRSRTFRNQEEVKR